MAALVLAILSSAMVSVIMRFSEGKVQSRMGFFLSNYLVCTLLGVFFAARSGLPSGWEGSGFALAFGGFSGFLFLYSFVMFRKSIARNGMVMSSTFMKLGVLIPTMMAILVFREQPGILQLLGIGLAVAAILLLNFEPSAAGQASGKGMLLLLLFVSGLTDGTMNIYEKMGTASWKDIYLAATFFSALCCTAFLLLFRRERPGKWDLLYGAAIGIPNYFSSLFLIGALRTVPAVIVYPVYSVGTIVVITAVGLTVFRESLGRRKAAAMLLIFAALALLNL